ncbi:MAG TPA: acetate--CoA ligase [Methylophaga sp.]|jgi:acetyl-CoA synthetase|uniref:acetate--CoA ligase n=1 Tax=unclassified Methylophaga TaxID=2629249 RepID=UPI000C8D0A0C|nr:MULTISPECIES: acetate--CoA ligase [unclassified Methylophaga]MAK65554.1 acetate--CoA ligase [Methylophaga sp.]HAO24535.1 acetate--CoA ligase [Methylophaga sp.]|tara:strand:- start:4136 stop:6097 length:1962 start_codon:yes stop_codon:yes gene_type:complete
MAQNNIESTLHENRHFPPCESFYKTSALTPKKLDALYTKADEDHLAFWGDLARQELDWIKPFTQTLDDSNAPFYKWFADGQLNVSYNCLDRQLTNNAEKTAIIFEGEPGDVQHITYRVLHEKVCVFANALKNQGIQKGDRVIIYMPMITEAVVAMQACARIGAIHSVVFGGFSAEALKDRIEDTQAKLVITADGGHRGGKIIPLKNTADQALAKGCESVETVIVFKRCGNDITLQNGRDIWWHDAEQDQSAECHPEPMNACDPLFLLYTSGSTGKPKGIQHSSAGYLLNAITTMRWVFDIQAKDVFWCTADVGWITGHTYVAYGPLAVGATMIIYEGVPTVPDAGRFWDVCARHHVTVFYTAPTAIRALMKAGDDIPQRYDLSHLRLLGTVGEPINPEAWMWYHRVIGQERCPIVDTWWQTETGAHMIAPVPAVTVTKPGSCTRALPGIDAAVVNEQGEALGANQGGFLVIRKPWPSMIQTIWGDDQRYKDTYWPYFDGKYYLAGDSARQDEEGYFWIMGRIDDVLNVSGHRLGTMEIESALVAHEAVAEAAVVGKPHDVKGESVFAYVVLKGERPAGGVDEDMTNELRAWVAEQIGPIAKPDEIRYSDNLPKTRSGKIMRRLLRTIAKGEEITQDTSTLENEGILLQLQGKA